jgi:hypothetical protein
MNPKPSKLLPALYGGIIMGLVSSIPFVNLVNCLCCAGVLLGGFLATYFYKSNFTPDTPPFTSGDCMAVGAISGVVGVIVDTLLSLLFLALFGDLAKEFVLHFLENMDLPQEAMDAIEQAFAEQTSAFNLITNFLFGLIIFPLFGMLGGLIGYNVYKPKQAMMPPPPPMPQPPTQM